MNIIRLPCHPESDLHWAPLLPLQNNQDKILWALELGPLSPLEEEIPFQAIYFALSHFTKTIWPDYQEATFGISFYQGTGDLSHQFPWTNWQEENWELWKQEQAHLPLPHLRRLFCRDAVAYYFQKLSHALPDEGTIYLFFEGGGGSTAAEMNQLLSKERFEHFEVVVKNVPGWGGLQWDGISIIPPISTRHAVVLPEEKKLTESLLNCLDDVIRSYAPIRVLPEPFLQEMWEGIDVLYVFRQGVSPQGERKLRGFAAAGGEICYL